MFTRIEFAVSKYLISDTIAKFHSHAQERKHFGNPFFKNHDCIMTAEYKIKIKKW